MNIEEHWAYGRDYNGFHLSGVKYVDERSHTIFKFSDSNGRSFGFSASWDDRMATPSEKSVAFIERKCTQYADYLRERARHHANAHGTDQRLRRVAGLPV